MRDDWYWFRVHDHIDEHPKVEPLSDAAFRLMVETWAYCRRTGNDGRIPDKIWAKRGKPGARRELVAAGLVRQDSGHVQVHDYLDWQQSAAEISEAKAKKSKAGGAGNHKKWHVDRGQIDPTCDLCATPPPIPDPSQVRSQNGRTEIAEGEVEREEQENSPRGVSYVPNARTTPPLYSDRCEVHADEPSPPPCGKCADARKANAAKPRLYAVGPTNPARVPHCGECDETRHRETPFGVIRCPECHPQAEESA